MCRFLRYSFLTRLASLAAVWHPLIPLPPPPPPTQEKENNPPTTLSRSESIMRMKYNLLERRFLKTPSKSPQQIQSWCRTQFPYFLEQGHLKFFENAGGAQVPSHVVSAVTASLSSRWRDNVGSTQKSQAKIAASHLLGFSGEEVRCLTLRGRSPARSERRQRGAKRRGCAALTPRIKNTLN